MGCTARDWFPNACLGVDTAKWQNPSVPWQALLDTGLFRFASIKWWHGPWRGDASTQACAEQQHREAKEAGFLVGRYAWWLPDQSAKDQAEAWTYVGWPSDELSLLLDFEQPDAKKGLVTLASAEELVSRIVDKTGVFPMIYSGKWWADQWLAKESAVLSQCRYWHAAYPNIQSKGTQYKEALEEWLSMQAPALPKIWESSVPIGWQADGDHGLVLPNGVDVDIDIADWEEIRKYAPNFGPVVPSLERYAPTNALTLDEEIQSLANAEAKKDGVV